MLMIYQYILHDLLVDRNLLVEHPLSTAYEYVVFVKVQKNLDTYYFSVSHWNYSR